MTRKEIVEKAVEEFRKEFIHLEEIMLPYIYNHEDIEKSLVAKLNSAISATQEAMRIEERQNQLPHYLGVEYIEGFNQAVAQQKSQEELFNK